MRLSVTFKSAPKLALSSCAFRCSVGGAKGPKPTPPLPDKLPQRNLAGNGVLGVFTPKTRHVSRLTETKSRRFQIPPVWKAPFSWRISQDGRPNRRNKAAFSNFSDNFTDLFGTSQTKRWLVNGSTHLLWKNYIGNYWNVQIGVTGENNSFPHVENCCAL